MDLGAMLVIIALVAIIPLALFFGLISLGILIWSWKRIGPYFVSFGRWAADWRNFIPLSCLGVVAIILTVLGAALLPDQLSVIRVILMWLVIAAGFVFVSFALLLWTARLVAWLWPRFRREFWSIFQSGWNFVSRGVSGERKGGGRLQAQRRVRRRAVADSQGQSESGVAPPDRGRLARTGTPSRRRGLLDLSWLWGLAWGRPQKVIPKPREVTQKPDEHVQAPVGPRPGTIAASIPSKPRGGLRPLIWRLGRIGRRPMAKKLGQRIPPAVATGSASAGPTGRAVPLASPPQPKAEASGSRPVEVKQRPTIIVRPRAKRGVFGSAGSLWRSLANRIEGARRGFWVGVFWAGRKARAGGGYVLRLLHLGGRRK